MIQKWKVENFKSILNPVKLDLAPLTIFTGANSSGKSTIIQSILMVAQSFSPSASDSQLVLNGDFVNLGHIDDVLHFGFEKQPLRIEFELQVNDTRPSLIQFETIVSSKVPLRSVAKTIDKRSPRVQEIRLEFYAPDNSQTPQRDRRRVLSIKSLEEAHLGDLSSFVTLTPEIREGIKEGIYDYVIMQPSPDSLVANAVGETVKRVGMPGLITNRLLIEYNVELRQLYDDVKWLTDILAAMADPARPPLGKLQPGYLSPYLADVFKLIRLGGKRSTPSPAYSEQKRYSDTYDSDLSTFHQWVLRNAGRLSQSAIVDSLRQGNYGPGALGDFGRRIASAFAEYTRKIEQSRDFNRAGEKGYEVRLFPSEYAWALDQIKQTMGQQVYYLGPLRSDPSVVYAAPPHAGRIHMGLKGEYTAAMLDEYRNIEIQFPLPLDDFNGVCQLKRAKLIEALLVWLNRMGLVESVDTEETPKVGYRLSVYSPGLEKKLDLTSVGVGVSQVLPTLVLSLLASRGSILIFEQPELHLHPKVQSVLADFFLGISMCGKQCIVETHSEHIINRLRRRIVESPGSAVLDQTKIYFVEKENDISQFRAVTANEYGNILDWPKGFFDQAEEESSIILRLQMQKRKAARDLKNQGEV